MFYLNEKLYVSLFPHLHACCVFVPHTNQTCACLDAPVFCSFSRKNPKKWRVVFIPGHGNASFVVDQHTSRVLSAPCHFVWQVNVLKSKVQTKSRPHYLKKMNCHHNYHNPALLGCANCDVVQTVTLVH